MRIVGAALGGWLFGGAFGTFTIYQGNLSLSGILVSLLDALILIAIMKLIRRVQYQCKESKFGEVVTADTAIDVSPCL